MKPIIFPTILQPLFIPEMGFLERSDIVSYTGSTHDDLIKLHFEHHARLIVTRPDLPGMSCESFVNVIRRNAAVRNVSILLLVGNAAQDAVRAKNCGANAVLPLASQTRELGDKIQELLDVPPRRSYRVTLNVVAEGSRNNRSFLCNMENISAHGMLVRTAESLASGDRITCSFYLPDGRRVSAAGNVARIVPAGNDGVHRRYGIQFQDLPHDDDAAISAFVLKESAQKQTSVSAG